MTRTFSMCIHWCPKCTNSHVSLLHLRKITIGMHIWQILGSLSMKAKSPLEPWEWAISFQMKWRCTELWFSSLPEPVPWPLHSIGCVHRGISDQQIYSGLSNLSTEQKSQLQRNHQHLGISPSCRLSDPDITRGDCSQVEEMLHKKRIGLLNLFHFVPMG
jgi:hypothetical protein